MKIMILFTCPLPQKKKEKKYRLGQTSQVFIHSTVSYVLPRQCHLFQAYFTVKPSKQRSAASRNKDGKQRNSKGCTGGQPHPISDLTGIILPLHSPDLSEFIQP